MIQALKDFANHVGCSITVISHGKLALNKYMASAIKNGLNVRSDCAFMVVNMGYHITDILVIKSGSILSHHSMSITYETFLQNVIVYLKQQHNVRIDESIAKRILDAMCSAHPMQKNSPVRCVVVGPNKSTSLPMRIPLSYEDIANCLYSDIEKFGCILTRIIDSMKANVKANIYEYGIQFTGDGTSLRGMAQHFEDAINIPCYWV